MFLPNWTFKSDSVIKQRNYLKCDRCRAHKIKCILIDYNCKTGSQTQCQPCLKGGHGCDILEQLFSGSQANAVVTYCSGNDLDVSLLRPAGRYFRILNPCLRTTILDQSKPPSTIQADLFKLMETLRKQLSASSIEKEGTVHTVHSRSGSSTPISIAPINPKCRDVLGRLSEGWTIANTVITLVFAAIALAVGMIYGISSDRQNRQNLKLTMWRDCVDLPVSARGVPLNSSLAILIVHSYMSARRVSARVDISKSHNN